MDMFPLKQKYIVTDGGHMVVFSELIQHSRFSGLDPISAGFISIYAKKDENGHAIPTVSCYGESISLRLPSREEDTAIAEKQILGNY